MTIFFLKMVTKIAVDLICQEVTIKMRYINTVFIMPGRTDYFHIYVSQKLSALSP
jgi:hypothetical protein